MTTNLPDVMANAHAVLDALPASFKRGVLSAASRLAGGALDVPAAWFDGLAQQMRDKTAGRSLVANRLATAAADMAGGEDEFVERTLIGLMGEQFRKQRNRDAIAIGFIEEATVTAGAPVSDVGEVGEDWMNVFVRYAEDASSEKLQGLWAKVLAGEVRAPGAFSLPTIRVLSELDQASAAAFERAAQFALSDRIVSGKDWDSGELFAIALDLEAAGLLSGAQGQVETTFELDSDGIGHFGGDREMLRITGRPGMKVRLPALIFTRSGRELRRLLRPPDEAALLGPLVELLKAKHGVQKLEQGTHLEGQDDAPDFREIWTQPDGPDNRNFLG